MNAVLPKLEQGSLDEIQFKFSLLADCEEFYILQTGLTQSIPYAAKINIK